jgi:leucine dehydrogenase
VAGIRAVLHETTGSDSLEGKRIAIQGVGHVGWFVAQYCREAGARVIVADPSPKATERARTELGAQVVEPDAIYEVECDVFSPCSIGAIVNDETIPRLGCKAIAGGANNVLAQDRHADALARRGIAYGPDYLVNAGGLIHCQAILRNQRNREQILRQVDTIYDKTREVFSVAKAQGITTAAAADRMAEARIARKKGGNGRG